MTDTYTTSNRGPRGAHYDLDTLLPVVTKRVTRGDFTSQNEMANAYGTAKSASTWWKRRAIAAGLIDETDWQAGFIKGQLNRLQAA